MLLGDLRPEEYRELVARQGYGRHLLLARFNIKDSLEISGLQPRKLDSRHISRDRVHEAEDTCTNIHTSELFTQSKILNYKLPHAWFRT